MRNSRQSGLGLITAFGTYVLLAFVAYKTSALQLVWNEMSLLLTGSVGKIVRNGTDFLGMFPVIFAVVVLELPCTIGGGVIQGMILGKSGANSINEMLDRMKEGNHFFSFFLMVLAEELMARWLFLGLIGSIPWFRNDFSFYALFLIGNALWALIHLGNYKNDKDKSVLRVLPQFIAGAFFTYVFVKYGLLAVILTHFASNAIIFAIHKVQKFDGVDVAIIVAHAVAAFASLQLMTKPVGDALQWFAANPVFALPGWTFGDYVKLSIFVTSVITLVVEMLAYDQPSLMEKKEEKPDGLVKSLLMTAASIGLIYLLYSFAGIFTDNVPYRILFLTIFFAFLQKTESGSATSRTFWAGLPNLYVMLCILQALSFWPAMGYMLVGSVVSAPFKALRKIND